MKLKDAADQAEGKSGFYGTLATLAALLVVLGSGVLAAQLGQDCGQFACQRSWGLTWILFLASLIGGLFGLLPLFALSRLLGFQAVTMRELDRRLPDDSTSSSTSTAPAAAADRARSKVSLSELAAEKRSES